MRNIVTQRRRGAASGGTEVARNESDSRKGEPSSFLRFLPFYLGGFMGPFGTALILPMFPELRSAFDATNEQVGLGFTAYLFPMAFLMLFSGTIGERFGKTRVLRITFLTFAVASLTAAAAPNLGLFLISRAVQGSCNAFFAPLLIAGLAELTPASSLGKQVGIYASFQTAGSAMSPLVGGLAAGFEWRAAFVGAAIVSFVLTFTLPKTSPPNLAASISLRPLLNRRVLSVGVAMMFGAAGTFGAIALLVGLTSRDVLDVDPSTAGVVIFIGNAAGLLTAPVWGRIQDRLGVRWTGVAAAGGSMLGVALTSLADSLVALTAVWVVTGGLIVGMVVTLQSLAATAVPENRAGGLSMALSLRFVGHALAPILWVPVFESDPDSAFLGVAALGVLSVGALIVATQDVNRVEHSST